MLSRIIAVAGYAVLTLALAGTAYWGYQEHQDKNSVLIKAENSYQRAFHDLNNDMANLEDELGKSIATNSRKLLAPCMANIWRIAYDAQSNIGQLPMNLTPFSKIETFLAQVGDYTYGIGMRNLETEPLTEAEWDELKKLHGQSKELQRELRKIQTKVLSDGLRWMDVEMAAAEENADMDKTLLDGMESIDKQVEGYIETEQGAEENKITSQSSDKTKLIEGAPVSEHEAAQKAKQFMGFGEKVKTEVVKNGEGNDFSSYSVSLKAAERENPVIVDVSKNGGHILWMLDSRDIEQSKIGLYEAQQKAEKFLEQRGMTSMAAVESDQYDNVGVFDFVYEQDGVRIYPEAVRVQVALDNGDLIGYEGLDYVINHDGHVDVPKPEISLEEAKEALNSNFQVMEDHLSMIETEPGEVKLCYELLGTIDQETFRIFVDAKTGTEEMIEKMKQAEPIV